MTPWKPPAGGELLSGLPGTIEGFIRESSCGAGHGFSLSPLTGDASDRAYFRVFSGVSTPSRATSFLLMQLAGPWLPGESGNDLPFVNIARHLAEKGIRVPRVHVDASHQGFVLLEDFGDETLESRVRSCLRAERDDWYRKALRMLVRMQREASLPSRSPCVALTYAFDAETFFRELCFFRQHAVEGLWGRMLSDAARRELDARFMDLCRQVAGYPQVFTHRDYHSRNLMVCDGELGVLDFQDARLGPVTYDLASLLRDAYVPLEPGTQLEMVGHYLDLCREAGGIPLPEPDLFRWAFVRTGLQRNLKALGTFAYQARVMGRKRYLESVPHTLRLVRLALDEDPDLAPLAQVLDTAAGLPFPSGGAF